MKKITLIFAAFGLAVASAQAWAEAERVDLGAAGYDDGDGQKLVGVGEAKATSGDVASLSVEATGRDGDKNVGDPEVSEAAESAGTEKLVDDSANGEVENFASLRVEDAGTNGAGTENLADDGVSNGDKSVADPKASDGAEATKRAASEGAGAPSTLHGNADDEGVVVPSNVDKIEKSETAKLIDEALEELEREDAAWHWNGAGTENVATSSAGTDFTIFGKTFHVDPTKSHAPLVEPVDLMPLVDKRVRLVLPDVDGTVTSKKKSVERTDDEGVVDPSKNLVDDGNSNSEVKNFASLSAASNVAGTISTVNSAGTVSAGTRSFFSVSSASAGTVFYSTATVSLTNAQTISDNLTGTDSGDSTGTENSTGTELTEAEKIAASNAEIIANKNNSKVTDTAIKADIVKAIKSLDKWNANRVDLDCSFRGYPFYPTDVDIFIDDYKNYFWSGSHRGPDYIFNPALISKAVDGVTKTLTRYDADIGVENRNEIKEVFSDKRYYYFIDQAAATTDETLRGAEGAVWAEFYPFNADGSTVSSSTYRLITGDTSEIFQTVGSVIMIDGKLGSFTSTSKKRLLDVYNAVLDGSLADSYSSFKRLQVHTPVVYLSGLISGTSELGGESFVIIEGKNTSLVFQKTENDRQYNELTVPIYFTGISRD